MKGKGQEVKTVKRLRVYLVGPQPGIPAALDIRNQGIGTPFPCWMSREEATTAAAVLAQAQGRTLGVFPADLSEPQE